MSITPRVPLYNLLRPEGILLPASSVVSTEAAAGTDSRTVASPPLTPSLLRDVLSTGHVTPVMLDAAAPLPLRNYTSNDSPIPLIPIISTRSGATRVRPPAFKPFVGSDLSEDGSADSCSTQSKTSAASVALSHASVVPAPSSYTSYYGQEFSRTTLATVTTDPTFGSSEANTVSYTILPPAPENLYARNLNARPRYPLDSNKQHELASKIRYLQGKERFPARSYHMFAHPKNYDMMERIHPGSFTAEEFEVIWRKEPIRIDLFEGDFREGVRFDGSFWEVPIPLDQIPVDFVFERGTVVVINGFDSRLVKYIATIRRHITKDTSFVQFNAYSVSQDELHFANEDWPTLIGWMPNESCNVPIPKQIVNRYLEYVTYRSWSWARLCGSLRLFRKFRVSNKKWEVEII